MLSETTILFAKAFLVTIIDNVVEATSLYQHTANSLGLVEEKCSFPDSWSLIYGDTSVY
jgi:hypothetical protein